MEHEERNESIRMKILNEIADIRVEAYVICLAFASSFFRTSFTLYTLALTGMMLSIYQLVQISHIFFILQANLPHLQSV